MKMTLLDIVQDILSDMEGSEVNSIMDTTESQQVARIVRQTFYYMRSQLDLREHFGIYELEAVGGVSKPTLMSIPSVGNTIQKLKYDCREIADDFPNWKEMDFIPLPEFLEDMHQGFPETNDGTYGSFEQLVNNSSIEFFYKNDKSPSKYTTIDDTLIVFDSYDKNVDACLQKSKTIVLGKTYPAFLLEDSFVPPLDADKFPLLYAEAKSQCYNDLRQMDNARADRRAKRLMIKSTEGGSNVEGSPKYSKFDGLPNYGRR